MNMEQALTRDPEFMELVLGRDFAEAVYGCLCNREFIGQDGRRWSCTWRYAAGFVAGARGQGESYVDYYAGALFGDEGVYRDLAERFLAIASRLGWREITPGEEAVQAIEAIGQVREIEARAEAPPPGWSAGWANLSRAVGHGDRAALAGRVYAAVLSGRIQDEEEFRHLIEKCHFSQEAAAIVARAEPDVKVS